MKRLILFIVCLLVILGGSIFNACRLEAITISPPVLEIEAERGEVIAEKVKLYNDTDKTKLYYLSKLNFRARGEDGQPEFDEEVQFTKLNQHKELNQYLSNWIDLPKSEQIILKPGQFAEIDFTILVPDKAEPGGHYGAIAFSDIPPELGTEDKSTISVAGKLAVLILLRVDGEINEKGEVVQFITKNNKKIWSYLPIDFIVKFRNIGNVHLKPKGKIILKDIFGKQIKSLTQVENYDENNEIIDTEFLDFLPVNFNRGNVLPASTRKFETVWIKNRAIDSDSFLANLKQEFTNFVFGRFSSELIVEFGEERQQILVRGPDFWVVPWRIILGILILCVLIVLIFSTSRFV